MTKGRLFLGALVAATLAFSGGGCGKPAPKGDGETIQVKGSDTLLMLSQRWAEAFMERNPGAVVQVTGGGSGVGIKGLIEGTTDIANSSRPIKEEEREGAAGKNVAVTEFKVAADAICFVVHPSNPLAAATVEQLGDIYRGKTKDWSAFGGSGKIMCYGRQSTSGTYDFVKSQVLNKDDYRADIQEMQGNSLLCESVARDANGIAYVGYGYAARRDDVKILAVKEDESSSAVRPSYDTVAEGTYPISRYLFNYVDGKPTGLTKEFLAFALSEEGQAFVEEMEYVRLPEGARAEMLAALE